MPDKFRPIWFPCTQAVCRVPVRIARQAYERYRRENKVAASFEEIYKSGGFSVPMLISLLSQESCPPEEIIGMTHPEQVRQMNDPRDHKPFGGSVPIRPIPAEYLRVTYQQSLDHAPPPVKELRHRINDINVQISELKHQLIKLEEEKKLLFRQGVTDDLEDTL